MMASGRHSRVLGVGILLVAMVVCARSAAHAGPKPLCTHVIKLVRFSVEDDACIGQADYAIGKVLGKFQLMQRDDGCV